MFVDAVTYCQMYGNPEKVASRIPPTSAAVYVGKDFLT